MSMNMIIVGLNVYIKDFVIVFIDNNQSQN